MSLGAMKKKSSTPKPKQAFKHMKKHVDLESPRRQDQDPNRPPALPPERVDPTDWMYKPASWMPTVILLAVGLLALAVLLYFFPLG